MEGKHGRPKVAERRKHARARINLEAVLQGERPEDDLRLKVLNFSAGGFFCRSSREIEPLTRLGITFQFPPYAENPPRTLETTAVVVRCETVGVAGWRLQDGFRVPEPRAGRQAAHPGIRRLVQARLRGVRSRLSPDRAESLRDLRRSSRGLVSIGRPV